MNFVDASLSSCPEAFLRARLDSLADLWPQRVDPATDTFADNPLEGGTTPLGVELQMNLSLLVPHGVDTEEVSPLRESVSREHLDVVPKAFGPVLVRVRATRAALHAIECRRTHAVVLSTRGRPVKVTT